MIFVIANPLRAAPERTSLPSWHDHVSGPSTLRNYPRLVTSVVPESAGDGIATLFTMPGGASSALKVAQVLGRNLPLVLLLVLVGALFWPSEEGEDTESIRPRPNGFKPPAPDAHP